MSAQGQRRRNERTERGILGQGIRDNMKGITDTLAGERERATTRAVGSQPHTFYRDGLVTIMANPAVAYEPDRNMLLTAVRVRIDDPGSTDTVIDVLVNGAVIETVTVPAGDNIATATISQLLQADVDLLSVQVTDAGIDARGLAVRFSAAS